MCLQGEFLGKGWRKLGLLKIPKALRENLWTHEQTQTLAPQAGLAIVVSEKYQNHKYKWEISKECRESGFLNTSCNFGKNFDFKKFFKSEHHAEFILGKKFGFISSYYQIAEIVNEKSSQ